MGIRACKTIQDLESLAAQAGLRAKILSDGRYQIRSLDGGNIKTFSTLRAAEGYVSGLVKTGNSADIDASSIFPWRTRAASSVPTRIQDSLQSFRRGIQLFQIGFAAKATPIKAFFQNVEDVFGVPLYEKVYQTTQEARLKVNRTLASEKIEELGQRTYMKALHELDEMTNKLDPEQRRLAILRLEAFTKDEIVKPGVFSANGIGASEIELGRMLEALNVHEEVPVLLRKAAIAEDFVENRTRFLGEYVDVIQNDIQAGRISQEFQANIDNLLAIAGEEKDFVEVLQAMGLTPEEYSGAILLKNHVEKGTDVAAAYRYAIAPEKRSGFKSGKAQFDVDRGVSKEAIEVSERRMELLNAAFGRESGLSAEMLVGAQYPVFRQFADAGLFPSMKTMTNKSGMMRKYSSVLQGMREGSRVFSKRVLSGHLNPYEFHPSITAAGHVRNVVMRRHFDHVLSSAAKFAKESLPESVDRRLRQVTLKYLNDIEGVPDESFNQLTELFRTYGKYFGVHVDDKLGERVVNVIARTTSQATIPFRAGLIVRNMTQSPFFTAPVVGPKAWLHGVKASVGMIGDGKFSIHAMREAIQEAVEAGAIDPNIIPLHASGELFGLEATRTAANLSGIAARAKFNAERLFDLGFSWYRGPDDWGRVVAFKAGKFRVKENVGDYIKGQITLDEFVERSKVKTFNETIEAQFRSIVEEGAVGWEDTAATLIGKELADKTHLLYGNANHPTGWSGVPGRLLGQFGTFPVQYANFVLEGISRGTLKDRAEFVAIHGALNMGVVAGGAELFDVDLTSWATLGSLKYTGGPYMEAAVSAFQAWGGSEAERSIARRNLQMMLPSFSSPESVFVPGSYFIGDLVDAFQATDPRQFFGEAAGIRFIQPGEETRMTQAFERLSERF